MILDFYPWQFFRNDNCAKFRFYHVLAFSFIRFFFFKLNLSFSKYCKTVSRIDKDGRNDENVGNVIILF